jgi:hypothetical protein
MRVGMPMPVDLAAAPAMRAPSPVANRCFARHAKDYAELSATPDGLQDCAGHFAPPQRPAQFNAALLEFVRSAA